MSLPPCGIYKTSALIGSVTPGHLVYFHNHGEPGPGIYLPETWRLNRAVFRKSGVTLPDEESAQTLEALAAEGFYRVASEFTCCAKRCFTFPKEQLVQLGYNGHAEPILFKPVWAQSGLLLPEKGQSIETDRVENLVRMRVVEERSQSTDSLLH
jgi:hypothetical protein